MTDLELILSILNKSNYMKNHFDCEEVEVITPNDERKKEFTITLRECADQVYLEFDENGNIL